MSFMQLKSLKVDEYSQPRCCGLFSWTSTDMLLYNILHMHTVHLVQLCSINGLWYCHLPPFCIDLFGHEPCIC